jgi:hypothetical protein
MQSLTTLQRHSSLHPSPCCMDRLHKQPTIALPYNPNPPLATMPLIHISHLRHDSQLESFFAILIRTMG